MRRIATRYAGVVGGIALLYAGHLGAVEADWQTGLGGPEDVVYGLDVAKDGSAYVGFLESGNGRRISVARVNGNTGSVDWVHTSKDGYALGGPAVAVVGNDVVAAWIVSGETVRMAGGGELQRIAGRIERIAPDGKALWQYTLDEAFEIQPVVVREAGDERLLIGGFVRVKPDDPQIAWMSLLSADGSPIWTRTYPEGGGVNDMAVMDGAHAVIVGYAFNANALPLDVHYFKPWAIRVDLTSGETEVLGPWSKVQLGEIRAVSVMAEGRLCFAGSHVLRPSTATGSEASEEKEAGWIGMLEADGTPIWDLVRADVGRIAGVATANNGVCVAAGQLEGGSFGPGSRWLGAFGSDGRFLGESRSDSDFDGAVLRVISRDGGALYVAGYRLPPVGGHGAWVARRTIDAIVSKAAFVP